jgi:glycosyltransferase involved in cell wall biosynthesis
LKIIVNTRLLIKNRLEGIGVFTAETLKIITKNNPAIEFIFLFDRKFDQQFIFEKNVKGIVVPPQARHPILFKYWFNYAIQRTIKKEKADLFLSPDGYLPDKMNIPSLAVIHDLSFEHFPEAFPKSQLRFLKNSFPKFATSATRIATVSEYSKKDIMKQYNIDEKSIDVVYNGSINDYVPIKNQEIKKAILQEYAAGEEFFIYIGSLHPRKNITNLLKAFDQFKEKTQKKHKILIVGRKMWWTDEMEKAYQSMKHQTAVVFTGHISKEKLKKILASATALCYLSYFEGFGIPLIEAFNAGIPVITSNSTSLAEVAANAALLCNPFDVDEIAAAMQDISDNKILREDLIQKGNQRAKDFSWEKSANLLWESMMKTIAIGNEKNYE